MQFDNDEDDLFNDISPEWKINRIKCLSIFVLQLFALEIDQNVISGLVPSYIKFVDSTADAQTFRVLLRISYFVALIVFQVIFARNADQTRKIKRLILLCNVCSIVGNVVYSVPNSILILMIGRFIRGIGSAVYAIVIGEVIRSYVPRDLYRAISMCAIGTVIGRLLGPAISSLLRNADFKIFTWQIRHENAYSLTTAAMFFVVFILTAAIASDLSLSFDLKANYQETLIQQRKSNKKAPLDVESDLGSDGEGSDSQENKRLFGSSVKESHVASSESTLSIISEIGRNPITLATLWASFVFAHTSGLYESQIMDLARNKIGVPKHYDSVIGTLGVLATGATFLVVGSLGERVGDVSWIYGGYALTILCGACWLIMDYLTTDNSALLSLFIIYVAALSISACGGIALQVLVGKLVPSNIQCFTEAFRSFFVVLGSNVAGLFNQLELSIPLLSAPLLAAVNVVTIAVINMNYQYLVDPKPLVQISSRKYY